MRLLLSALFIALAVPVRAETALVAVATNFRPVVEALAPAFEGETGHRIELSAAATGKLAAQVEAGAPFDVFLAADTTTPDRLVSEGFADSESRFTYAVGQLVLWSANPAADLGDPTAALRAARHIAIANPEIAPYGKAAMQSLAFMGLPDLSDKFVTGENIGQTHALVASRAAELGFVAGSAVTDGTGTGWTVPADHHDPIRQDAVLLAHGEGNPAASAFLAYLRSDAARAVIARFGYTTAP
ncbi:molybdate ABC transporter substrate-binding protein [Defluviimonas sp. SAOS-178_SWC]|uniref:molybdate ABC transporter substrate-binding protein n=1 Tax=Defluviimonas sp. SAOS-178_SWC TaxID=3121287 RepID=UPI0032219CE1